jgi:nucleoside-diphosphate-sugar epimerase/SAM-dependent methyltransferase/quercetin dioxygenase-like cupin family protein
MKKIVITGGLGYIGTEVCKIYSGQSWCNEIVVIDNRFASERVKQLTDWGIKFVHDSILDENLVKEQLSNADVIIHLAGITDVAYTKTEINSEVDEKIKNVGIDGTRNIIKYASKYSKIIFPSTHVLYEGFDHTITDIEESLPPKPVLTYSTGKYQSELDLINSGKNYIILRLGSVYGYSTDTMRINIMPNLFSKIASQNGVIKLFSNGVQLKSLVPLIDVARCINFMSENNFNKEIFNLTKENVTVKDVALLCKEINPNVSIVETDDIIPNLGYTLSNKKLLETGFEFRHSLKESLTEMITSWSKKKNQKDLEYIIRGGKEYIDNRGKILNYELPEPINLIGYIESKKGTVRANHYHPIQEQKCLLIKGKYISVVKDLLNKNSVIETRLISEGDIAVIKPNVAHTMIFLEDSIFLNLVRGEREHENYGITHTIPYTLVDSEFAQHLLDGFKQCCRSCKNLHMKKVVSLGKSPLANNLLDTNLDSYKTYPLEIDYCEKCYNVQLNYVVPPSEMFDNYLYVSSTSKSFRKHFEDAAIKYIDMFKLKSDSTVIDIGSNDGIALRPFKERGISVIGVEPAKNLAEMANSEGIPTINGYFDDTLFKNKKFADIVTASNVFAHNDELTKITLNVFNILKPGGTFIIEVQYILDVIKDTLFDNIYHEHVNYWSVTSLVNFFNNIGFRVTNIEHIDTHGGSIRVYIQDRSETEVSDSVNLFLENEKIFGLLDYNTYSKFGDEVKQSKINVINNIKKLKETGKLIIGYGAPAKATTLLNYYELTNEDISYIVEDNKLKYGKIVPGTNIPIINKPDFTEKPAIIIIFAWNFKKEIIENNKKMITNGSVFVSIKDLMKPLTQTELNKLTK